MLPLASCGDARPSPVSVDSYIDATFSNDQVAKDCLDDVLIGSRVAAKTFGRFSVHTFDGDPLRRRGLNFDFGDIEIPRKYEGTSEYDDYVEEMAEERKEELRPEVEDLIAEPPEVGGTPVAGVLTRAARANDSLSADSVRRVVICTDALFTDLSVNSTEADVRRLGEDIEARLDGATVDFIGVAASAPNRGPTTERTRPLVEQLVTLTGARMGIWDVELPATWETEVEAEAEEAK